MGAHLDQLDAWRYVGAYPRVSYPTKRPSVDQLWLYNNWWEEFERSRKLIRELESRRMNMKLKDLHSGYVVALRDGSIWAVARAGDFERILVDGKGSWGYLDKSYNEDLTLKNGVTGVIGGNKSRDIMKVYGLVSNPRHWQDAAHIKIGLSWRPLLWERKEARKLTVSQISKLLGYDVEVVAEGQELV